MRLGIDRYAALFAAPPLVWSALAFVYLLLLKYNLYLIFIIGIPIQVLVILWSQIRKE